MSEPTSPNALNQKEKKIIIIKENVLLPLPPYFGFLTHDESVKNVSAITNLPKVEDETINHLVQSF